jgi:hypothetical protein
MLRTSRVQSATTYSNTFTNADDFDAASWAAATADITGGQALGSTTANVDWGNVLKASVAPAINDSAHYSVSAQLGSPSPVGSNRVATVRLFAGMDDAAPNRTTSVSAEFGFTTAGFEGEFTVVLKINNVTVGTYSNSINNFPWVVGTWVKMTVRRSGVNALVEARYNDQLIITAVGAFTAAGGNVGFTIEQVGTAGTVLAPAIDELVYTYYADAGNLPLEAVVASAGGELWVEQESGELSEITTYNGMDLASDRLLSSADRLGKLFIADYGLRTEETAGQGGIVNGVLDNAGVADWTALGIDEEGDVVEIKDVTGGAGVFAGDVGGFFAIDAIHATNGITLADLSTGTALVSGDNATTCNYRVIRAMKYYDSANDTLNLYKATDGKGDPPHGCTILTVYRDRITAGGDPDYPGVWFMSRQGDPFDWDYGSFDQQAATASIAANSETGGLPAPVTAMAPISEDYLIIGARSELYVLRGDPMVAGQLDNLSQSNGVLDLYAWCGAPDGSWYYMSRDGLYRLPGGPLSVPQPVSRTRLPRELTDIDTNLFFVNMEYDVRDQLIYIFVTPRTAGLSVQWTLEIANGAFWLEQFPVSAHRPTALVYNPSSNMVLLGSTDGYIRRFDSAFENDDGTDFSSHIAIGPVRLAAQGMEGMVVELSAVLDHFSGDVTWVLHVGDQEFGVSQAATGTWGPNSNYIDRPNARGRVAYVIISGTPGSRWAMEVVELVRRTIGPYRKR